MMKAWQHFKTITTHKIWVMRYCFKIGLYWQGLTHDLSKYSPTEFLVGMKYYQRKPNGSKPGFVVYYTNYSMMAEPNIRNLQEVQD